MKYYKLLLVFLPILMLSSCKKEETAAIADFEIYTNHPITSYRIVTTKNEKILINNVSPIAVPVSSSPYKYVYRGSVSTEEGFTKLQIHRDNNITYLRVIYLDIDRTIEGFTKTDKYIETTLL